VMPCVGGHTEEAGVEVESNGADQWRGERESCCLPCSSVDAPETAVLIAMCSMDIHQYDRCHYLDHVPSGLETGRTDPYLSSHWGNTSDILKTLDE